MIYISLVDLLFMLLGLLIGVVIMSLCAASGYTHKCDNCVFKEILEDMENE